MAEPSRVRTVAIILNWRQAEPTLLVLEDLRAQHRSDLHTLLVDNGSGDGSAERLLSATDGDPRAETLALEQNLGYCAGVNRGLARARELRAERVLLLNNDVRIPEGSIETLEQAMDNDPDLTAVGPTILDPSGRAWSQGGGVRFRSNLVALHGQGAEPAPVTAGPEFVEFLPGACALYRLDALDAIGGLDERYFMYWEDVALGASLRRKGAKVVWLPWVRITHDASLSSGGGISALRKYLCAVNVLRYLRDFGRPRDWCALLLFDVLLWPLSVRSGPRAAWAKLRGTIDGFLGRQPGTGTVARWTRS